MPTDGSLPGIEQELTPEQGQAMLEESGITPGYVDESGSDPLFGETNTTLINSPNVATYPGVLVTSYVQSYSGGVVGREGLIGTTNINHRGGSTSADFTLMKFIGVGKDGVSLSIGDNTYEIGFTMTSGFDFDSFNVNNGKINGAITTYDVHPIDAIFTIAAGIGKGAYDYYQEYGPEAEDEVEQVIQALH